MEGRTRVSSTQRFHACSAFHLAIRGLFGHSHAMICYAVLCCAVLCYAELCYAELCYAELCYAMLSYAMLCYDIITLGCLRLLACRCFQAFYQHNAARFGTAILGCATEIFGGAAVCNYGYSTDSPQQQHVLLS